MSKLKYFAVVVFLLLVQTSCAVVEEYQPDKYRQGNVEIRAEPLAVGEQAVSPRVYLKGKFIGNASADKPVLYLKRGSYVVRVELEGHETWEQKVRVLGAPTMQVVHVRLKKLGE